MQTLSPVELTEEEKAKLESNQLFGIIDEGQDGQYVVVWKYPGKLEKSKYNRLKQNDKAKAFSSLMLDCLVKPDMSIVKAAMDDIIFLEEILIASFGAAITKDISTLNIKK